MFDRQADYMEYVNRQIFGFDTVEEYKEMIDLLIQLRTPKLSKDFKPSVINDILSDSLQPLSMMICVRCRMLSKIWIR